MVKVRFIGVYWDDLDYLKTRVESNWGNASDYGIKLVTDDDFDYQVIINDFPNIESTERNKNIGVVMEPCWSSNYNKNLQDYCFLTLTSDKSSSGEGVVHCPNFMFYEDSQDPSVSFDKFKYNFNFNKPKKLSIIVSNWNCSDKSHNYYWREKLVKDILDTDFDIDIFGKNWDISDSRYKGWVKDKVEGLKDYEYSIAIENSCEDYYVSEKLFDCFLNNTVPIYYGCKNVSDFYDSRSLETFDLKKDNIINTLKNIIKVDNNIYKDYVLKSKAWYFTRYNLLHYLKENIM
jgi:hypothetical protein